YGDGNQTRSFCYVDDLVKGLILMMEQNKMMGPVNMGNPDEITILQLAEEIINLTNSKSKIIYKDLPDDDPVQRQPDIALAREKLDWMPGISREEGLRKTIAYFQEIL
ncbi:MAG: GDP-mannose 4,6-dehydratase, partial [Bacteroidetes bacterium]|nr:GDP-mannose 4,6-dehydratase [Bacteroidota bacterium]